MFRFVELEDGTYRLTIEIKGNPSFSFNGRFQQTDLKPEIPEKENGFKFESEVKQ